MLLRARNAEFVFPRPTVLMGIVNVTPDSFSDGGSFLEPNAAVDRALQLAAEGAEILDIGGESSRPNAIPVSEGEELRRVIPVLERLAGRTEAVISIDTCKLAVAREALQAGAGMVNDVCANREDTGMWHLVAETQAAYVAMHMQGSPETMQRNPTYGNVRQEIADFFEARLARLTQIGVGRDQLVLDVGIGFGKTRPHNLSLLAGLSEFARFGRPLLIGLSRKSFLGKDKPPRDRLPAGLAATCWAVQAGAQIIRTHDVGATLEAVRLFEEMMKISTPEA